MSGSRGQALKKAAARSWKLNRLVLVLAIGYMITVEIASRLFAFPHSLSLYHKPLVVAAFIGVFVVLLAGVIRERPDRPLRFMWNMLRTRWDLVERIVVIAPPVIVLALMLSSFSSIKSSIQHINPTFWDPLFLEWDRVLHGGQDPWRLLHPVLGHPVITRVVEWFYSYWLGISLGVLIYAIFMRTRIHLRNQFIGAWILAWALPGTIGALALNSVGPCFYGLFFPEEPDPFRPLMDYLAETAPITIASQEYLWVLHQELGPGFGTGISAMPSMHVFITALQVPFLWRLSRTAGVLGLAFAVIILVGSVHLGWHYAIDGYAAILLVPLVWWGGGWLVHAVSVPSRESHGRKAAALEAHA